METIKKWFKENTLICIISYFILFSLIIDTLGYLVFCGFGNLFSYIFNSIFISEVEKLIISLMLVDMFTSIIIFNLCIFFIWKLTLHFTLKSIDNSSDIQILKPIKIIVVITTIIITAYMLFKMFDILNFFSDFEENTNTCYQDLLEMKQQTKDPKIITNINEQIQIINVNLSQHNTLKTYYIPSAIIKVILIVGFNICSYFIIKREYFRKYANN